MIAIQKHSQGSNIILDFTSILKKEGCFYWPVGEVL